MRETWLKNLIGEERGGGERREGGERGGRERGEREREGEREGGGGERGGGGQIMKRYVRYYNNLWRSIKDEKKKK